MKKIVKIIFLSLMMTLALASCKKKDVKEDVVSSVKETTEAVIERKKVMVYTSLSEDLMKDIEVVLEKKYDDMDLAYFVGSDAEILDKINSEKTSKVEADVVLFGNQLDYESLKNDNLLEKYKSDEANVISNNFVDKEGYYTCVNLLSSMRIAWSVFPGAGLNRKNSPKTWDEMLNEKYKDHIVMLDPNVDEGTKFFVACMMRNDKYGKQYFNKLKENNIVIGDNIDVYNDLANGNYYIGFCSDETASILTSNGAPIGFKYADNDNMFTALPIALIKNASNQAGAKLFIDFVLSKDGQEMLSTYNYVSVRDDVNENIVSNMKIDYKDIIENQDKYIEEFNAIFEK